MAVSEDREFDIIIFGATGYTGRYVIEELAHTSVSSYIRWAIAGRNKEKLKESLDIVQGYLGEGYTGQYVIEELAQTSVSTNTKWAVAGRNKDKLSQSVEIVQGYLGEGINISNIPIIEADVKDVSSLSNMCKRCKLVINCVGPYKQFGEPVIQACIENGTHHVDLSGEMKFLEETQMKYFNAAREKRIYIVGACGFDSIPADYGITVLKENFPGDLNSIEFYAFIGVGPSGRVMNIGTFLSAIYSVWDHMFVKRADRALKESLFPKDLPQTDYSLPWKKPPLFHSSDERAWSLWFKGPDERVILRSQLFRYNFLNERPVLSHGYLKLKSFCSGLGLLFGAIYLAIMAICGCGRSLLAKYPSFFTAGNFTSAGPTRQQVMEGTTRVTFYGQGWKDTPSDPNERRTTKPDLKMKLIIEGPEPAYALTSMCIVQAGLTILEDHDRMPLEGGVLTPGIAFANTSLRQRLEKRGVTFKFENTNEALTV